MTLSQTLYVFEYEDKKFKRFLHRLFNRKQSLRSTARDMAFMKLLKPIEPNYS